MKRLFLMRHAKSDWGFDVPDFDRPLNERGMNAAPKIGEELKKRNIFPDLIMSSTALRSRTTAELFSKANSYNKEIQFVDDLYLCSESTVLKHFKQIPDNFSNVLIISHNPTCENIFIKLNKNKLFYEFKTATIASLKSEIEQWNQIEWKSFDFEWILYPKELS
jgi:phosphohistidine phosphatase